MNTFRAGPSLFNTKGFIFFAILFSGICWYLANELSGNFGYLLWIAPIPVLLVAYHSSAKTAFLVSWLAYLLGRLSWFGYLVTVATLVPAIIDTLLLSFIFALIILPARRMVVRTKSWYSVFAFPVFFTTFEFLLMILSPDGTAASIAYSQSNYIPVIQIAAVTGIAGITFLLTFFPSLIATGWFLRKQSRQLQWLTIAALVIIIPAMVFGIMRVRTYPDNSKVVAGLVALPEKTHYIGNQPDFAKAIQHIGDYREAIKTVAAKGARLVVLPERGLNINAAIFDSSLHILSDVAKQYHITIIAGYTNFRLPQQHNSALVIDPDGHVIVDYNKVHMVPGLEDRFTPGKAIGIFNFHHATAGIAICKDLDFPRYIRRYGDANTNIVCIPAWDFVVDDWLHSRMAILRGVENGFSEIRTARQGRLTISDYYGRVTAEASCAHNEAAMLTGAVRLKGITTVYTRLGDWFGILNLLGALVFILMLILRKPHRHFQN